jgi:hypothetical protein
MDEFENLTEPRMYTEQNEAIRQAKVKAYTGALLQVVKWGYGIRGLAVLEPQIRKIDDAQSLASLIKPALYTRSVTEFEKMVEGMILALKK